MKRNRIKLVLALVITASAIATTTIFINQLSPEDLLHAAAGDKYAKYRAPFLFYVMHTDAIPADYKTEFNIPILHLLINVRSMEKEKTPKTMELIEYFIDKGSPINEASGDKMGLTPLHLAVMYADKPLAEKLILKGAIVNTAAGGSSKYAGMTPLRFSKELKKSDNDKNLKAVQDLLLKHGGKE